MPTIVKCGTLFTGEQEKLEKNRCLIVDDGRVTDIKTTVEDVSRSAGPNVLDYSKYFVMPGLCDYHTHLGYGNAKTEEDIDLYAPVEFRALRGLFMAQKTLSAGITSICNPGGPGRVGIAIREAINSGMFDGPRVTTTGPYITSHQGLTDWYPTWIGQPETSIGHLVKTTDEAIAEIRAQVKDGVDAIKIAMDGTLNHSNPAKGSGLVAAFNQDETKRMIHEVHRLGKRTIVHARGKEAILYSARAGADVIFHASWMDDECLEAILQNKCAVCPSLTMIVNCYEFSQPSDAASRGWSEFCRTEAETAFSNISKARRAGVPIIAGSETGFAMTPYGEWHAKELDLMVRFLGMSAIEALQVATAITGRYLFDNGASGGIKVGSNADLLVIDGDPTRDVRVLLDKKRIKAVILGGRVIAPQARVVDPGRISDFSQQYWSDLYTQERVAQLESKRAIT